MNVDCIFLDLGVGCNFVLNKKKSKEEIAQVRKRQKITWGLVLPRLESGKMILVCTISFTTFLILNGK